MAWDSVRKEIVRATVAAFVGMLAVISLPFLLIYSLGRDGSPWLWLVGLGLALAAWSILQNGVVRTVRRRIPARVALVDEDGDPGAAMPKPRKGVYREWMLSSPLEKMVLALALISGGERDEARARIRNTLNDDSGRVVFDDFRRAMRRDKNQIVGNALAFGLVAVYIVWRVTGAPVVGSFLLMATSVVVMTALLIAFLAFLGVQSYGRGLQQARDALHALHLLESKQRSTEETERAPAAPASARS